MIPITEEDSLGYKMENSSHGTLRFEDWCKAEVERLQRAGIYSIIKYKRNRHNQKVCYIVREIDDAYKELIDKIYDKNAGAEKKRIMRKRREKTKRG